ncbi:MAG TPA: sigma-70 family RNA polymerase sigma factor [Xanthobacteraceae bacterium]|jgi:RNA polymerase sigma-70 factor (ECF subfamily)|nr:sigma-70 family RNA polymerase sigma factor [Xanthobacteraceae bacterium]
MQADRKFEQILLEHGAMIRRIASSHEAKPHLAEELVQEIYLAVWKALPAYRNQATLRTFLARIATNRAVTHVARSMRTPRSVELDESLPAPDVGPEGAALAHDRRNALLAAMRSLPLALRQPAMLAAEGLAPAEISDVLGISVNAVAIRMSRARDALRKVLPEGI